MNQKRHIGFTLCFIISTVMAYTQILVSGGKIAGFGSYGFYLDSVSCNAKGKIIFSPADTSIKDYLYTVVSIDTIRKINKTQISGFFDSIPKGYYNLFIKNIKSNAIDTVTSQHLGFLGFPYKTFTCNKPNEAIYLLHNKFALQPLKIFISESGHRKEVVSNIINDSISYFRFNDSAFQHIVIKDVCGDSVLFNTIPSLNVKGTFITQITCDSTILIKPQLQSVVNQSFDPLLIFPFFKYHWVTDTFQFRNQFSVNFKSAKKAIPVQLILEDSLCNQEINQTLEPIYPGIQIKLLPAYSCNPDSNYIHCMTSSNYATAYLWNTKDTTQHIQVVKSGNYSIIATNVKGCKDSASLEFIVSRIALTTVKQDNVCFGQANASIQLTPENGIVPYSFSWNDHVFTQNRTNLTNKKYEVTVTDSIGCKKDTAIEIKSPPALTLNISIHAASCIPAHDGSVSSKINGGKPPYDMTWSNGLKVNNVDTLGVGNYKITILDSNQCKSEFEFKIDDLSPYIGTRIDTICDGAVLTINNKKYTSTGRYVDTLKTPKGCDSILTIILNVNPAINYSLTKTDPTCFGISDASILISKIVGYPAFTYFIDGKAYSLPQLNNVSAGNHVFKLVDRFGCFKEQGIAIPNPEKFNFFIGNDTLINFGDTINLIPQILIDPTKIKSITWTTSPDLTTCNLCNSFKYIPLRDTKITATLESISGCKITDDLQVKVNFNFKAYAPNVFFPARSMDPSNQYFTILGSRQLKEIEYLRIYNRYGDLLFYQAHLTPNDFSSGWDGTYKGQPVGEGVYVYVAGVQYIDGKKEIVKGDLTLLR